MTVIQETQDVSTPQTVKAAALKMAEHLFQNPWTLTDAERIKSCALRQQPRLQSPMDISQDGCRHPHCPICQHEKAYAYGHHLGRVFQEQRWQSDSQWVAITFSVRQCQVTELSECLEAMEVAFRRMSRRRFWSRHVQGALRVLRVDPGFSDANIAHPRFQCVLLLQPDVAKDPAGFREDAWNKLWRDCFGEDFIAEVHPENVEPIEQDVRTQVQHATIQTLRPNTTPTSSGWLLKTMPQMDPFRWMESFGVLRRLTEGSHDPNAM